MTRPDRTSSLGRRVRRAVDGRELALVWAWILLSVCTLLALIGFRWLALFLALAGVALWWKRS